MSGELSDYSIERQRHERFVGRVALLDRLDERLHPAARLAAMLSRVSEPSWRALAHHRTNAASVAIATEATTLIAGDAPRMSSSRRKGRR